MSRIGRAPVELAQGVTVDLTTDGYMVVTGPKGSLRQQIDPRITLERGEHNGKPSITLIRANDSKDVKAKHGLYRALLANMVKGVTEGFSKSLTVAGVGYKLQVAGDKLTMNLGLSHPVVMTVPEGLTVTLPTATEILVSGISKEKVGQFAADIKAVKPVEPYHGYGIHYTAETVRRKEIKKGSKKK